MSYLRLANSVANLIKFLRPTGSECFVQELTVIEQNLRSDSEAESAATKLDKMFGGMGSLNDNFFCVSNQNLPLGELETEFNKRFDKLMDETYTELVLRKSGFFGRMGWYLKERKSKNHLPPRIRKTFR